MESVSIRLFYWTQWQPCIMHYSLDGEERWQDMIMDDCKGIGRQGWMRAELFIRNSIEFVLCNEGKNNWDNPPSWQLNANYEIFCKSKYNNESSTILDNALEQTESEITSNEYCPLIYTLVAGQLSKIEGPPVMLVCDLDGTLIGHADYLEQFNLLWLRKHVWRDSLLVYNTGRNLKDALVCSQEENLLQPDFLVCGVGTELYYFDATPSEEYLNLLPVFEESAEIKVNWKFPWWCPSFQHVRILSSWRKKMMNEFSRDKIELYIQENFPDIQINGTKLYDPWRLSLSVSLQNPDFEKLLFSFDRSAFKILVSGAGEWRFFDILPHSGGKLYPILFLMKKRNFLASQVLVCGDSGNDIDMFTHPEFRCCCVSNAQLELLAFLDSTTFKPTDPLLASSSTASISSKILSILQQERPSPPRDHVVFAEFPCAGGIIQAMQIFGYG